MRCAAGQDPSRIACWTPHGAENDKEIPFESFDTVIDVSASGRLTAKQRSLLEQYASPYDSQAILVRGVQEIISPRATE